MNVNIPPPPPQPQKQPSKNGANPPRPANMLLVLSPCSSVCSRCPKSLSCTMATLVGRRRWLGLGGPGSPAAHDPDSLGLRCDPKDPMIIYRILYIVYSIHLLSIQIISHIYIIIIVIIIITIYIYIHIHTHIYTYTHIYIHDNFCTSGATCSLGG